DTPTMVTPEDESDWCSSFRSGISFLHGSHQLAQKFTSVAPRRKSRSDTRSPRRFASEKTGAFSPTDTDPISPPPHALAAAANRRHPTARTAQCRIVSAVCVTMIRVPRLRSLCGGLAAGVAPLPEKFLNGLECLLGVFQVRHVARVPHPRDRRAVK